MTEPRSTRWSDKELERFHEDFKAHVRDEDLERKQQDEIYEALFRKEDKEANQPPGVIQLLSQMNSRMRDMEIAADRQKTFIGGVVFAFSCMGFFFTDTAHKVVGWLKGL